MVIWEYDVPAAARSLGWAVVANNIEALKILLGCGYGVASLLAAVGAVARWGVARAILWSVGLQGLDGGTWRLEGWQTGGDGKEDVLGMVGRNAWTVVREWGGRLGGL
jgi:hypothetical protein